MRKPTGTRRSDERSGEDYVPDAGDVVHLNFTPQAGREQAGPRSALVLSPGAYNRATGLMVACPLTRQAKGYPFEVAVDGMRDVTGVILADHLRSLDWRARSVRFVEKAPEPVLALTRAKLSALLGIAI